MSVDCEPVLAMGWYVEYDEMEHYEELKEDDFEAVDKIDGVGQWCGEDWCINTNGYDDTPDCIIGWQIPTTKVGGDLTWEEFSSQDIEYEKNLKIAEQVYEMVCGKKPETAPSVILDVQWC